MKAVEATNVAKAGKVNWALFNPKTYATMLYLLLALPLGIIYFTVAITGFAISIALTPVFIGIPMFFGMAKLINGIVSFEQGLIRHILGLPVPPAAAPKQPSAEAGTNWFMRMVKGFDGELFFRNLMLVVLRLVTGIVFFAVMIVALALGIGFIALPVVHIVLMNEYQLDILENNLFTYFHLNWTYNQQYLLYVGVGLFLFWVALRVVNGLMQVQRRIMYVDEAYLQPAPEPSAPAPASHPFHTPVIPQFEDDLPEHPETEKVWLA
ncbi:sensor domain-containing protein [Paenibacillus barengoltzii]|uniref:sensor domain-containing protein n=1 Tax=Paenibacillus barengoltzii TaxID=343517 RepID=UPI002FDA06B2